MNFLFLVTLIVLLLLQIPQNKASSKSLKASIRNNKKISSRLDDKSSKKKRSNHLIADKSLSTVSKTETFKSVFVTTDSTGRKLLNYYGLMLAG